MMLKGVGMAGIKYEVVNGYGILSESSKGWTKELRQISWNGREPKFDIREWAPDDEKMGKGVTLTKDELLKLRDILNDLSL